MRIILIAILFNLAFGEVLKRRMLKGDATCFEGEYKVTNGAISYCVKCSDNCEAGKCVDGKGCTQCKKATFSDGKGGCDACMLGCDECVNAHECKKCNPEKAYMMGNNCYLKPVQCKVSQDQKGCVECNNGYFLTNVTNGNCTACSSDGKGCVEGQCNPKTTSGCQRVVDTTKDPSQGYYIEKGVAWKCDENCAVCYEKTRDQSIYKNLDIPPGSPNKCLQCKPGYFWYESAAGDMKFCKKCDIQCATCENVEYNCKSCGAGYIRYYAYQNSNGTNVHSCRKNDTNCATYIDVVVDSKNKVSTKKCTQCKDGYILDASEYCVPIHSSLNATSKTCGSDFAVEKVDISGETDAEKVKVTCRPKSEHCIEYNKENLCTKCTGLTYLSNGFCLPCHENCVECDNISGVCYHCKPDYYSNKTFTCRPDFTSVAVGANEKLWDIGTNDQPIRCVEGKYVDFANRTKDCKTCSQYCLEENIPQGKGENATVIKINYCDTAVGCLRCKEGFYVSPNGECSSCSPHCALCDQTLGCLHCLGDTVMVDGRCQYSGATSVLTLLILLILALAI